MAKRESGRQGRPLSVERDLKRLQQLLVKFKPVFSKRSLASSVETFDEEAESVLGEIFGQTSEFREAYEYATLGEAAGLVNIPEEAQENGAYDLAGQSFQQRKQVLESCVRAVESLRIGGQAPAYKSGSNGQPEGMVAEYMSTDVRSVHKDAPLKEAGRLFNKWKVGSLLVDDDRRYVGIITDTDLSRKAVAKGLDPTTTPIKTCMSKPVVTIEDSELLTVAIELMKEKGVRHLAVTEDETIIGVLSVSDVLRAYGELAGLSKGKKTRRS
jgi:CBS domain-containing protein